MLKMFMENNERMNSRDRQFKNKGKGKANWKRRETEVGILRFSECPRRTTFERYRIQCWICLEKCKIETT